MDQDLEVVVAMGLGYRFRLSRFRCLLARYHLTSQYSHDHRCMQTCMYRVGVTFEVW